jgi:hypothetical protein
MKIKEKIKFSALPNHYHVEKHGSEMSEWNMQATLYKLNISVFQGAACLLSLSVSLSLSLWLMMQGYATGCT